MAKKCTLLVVLWIVAAFAATSAQEGEGASASPAPTEPTEAPTEPTEAPTAAPTEPTEAPTAAPTEPTAAPTEPTEAPTEPTAAPTEPTEAPTEPPTEPTAEPPTGPTAEPPTGPATTKDPDTSATEAPDGTSTPEPPATTSPDPCASSPCGAGSTCDPRVDQSFVCLCLPGESYDDTTKSCNKGKVFPGDLQLSGIQYSEELENRRSQKFQVESGKITKELDEGLKGKDRYVGSTVLGFRKVQSKSKSARNTGVIASVEMIYAASSAITESDVKTAVDDLTKCEDCALAGTYTATDLCASNACDSNTTTCESTDGSFTCNCGEGYIKTNFAERICVACPSGYKAENSEKCLKCSFGYSGLNCKENWQLLLVIIGSVLGGLLLITLIILPVVALKSPKKKSKKSKEEDIGKPYVSHSPAKAPLVNSSFVSRPTVNGSANGSAGNVGVPRIPRATSNNNNWDNRNNLEMTQGNSRQNLVPGRNSRLNDDQDDTFYSQSRPQGNPYAQSRPQTNPYVQNRASVNPYAERQGHSNPYYTHDDGRRY